MGTDCSGDDHRMLVNLICQDLEHELYPDFADYFIPSRLDSLALIKDHCLQILVGCARGPDFLSPVAVPEAYSKARRSSLRRVAGYVYKQFSTIDSPAALQLQASLWPMASGLYANATQDSVIFDLLQRIFKYPVPCYGCLDGPGHLISHLFADRGVLEVTQKVTLFGKIPLEGKYMPAILLLISTLPGDGTPSLASYFPQVEEHILRKLEEQIKEILCSQFNLLVMIWNSTGSWSRPEVIGGLLVGIQKALLLPSDWRSIIILAPLSLKIRRLRENMLAQGKGSFVHLDITEKEATITSQLLLDSLAVRLIFGGQNSRRLFCARSVGGGQAAIAWLPPYEV